MNVERAMQVAHVVSLEQGANIRAICVRMAPSAMHIKLDASARLDGLDLPAAKVVLR